MDFNVPLTVEGHLRTNDPLIMTIIIMYVYHAIIDALSAHMIRDNLNTIFYTHVEQSPTNLLILLT